MDPKLREAISDLFALNLDTLDIVETLLQGYPETPLRDAAVAQLATHRAHLVKADEAFRSLATAKGEILSGSSGGTSSADSK